MAGSNRLSYSSICMKNARPGYVMDENITLEMEGEPASAAMKLKDLVDKVIHELEQKREVSLRHFFVGKTYIRRDKPEMKGVQDLFYTYCQKIGEREDDGLIVLGQITEEHLPEDYEETQQYAIDVKKILIGALRSDGRLAIVNKDMNIIGRRGEKDVKAYVIFMTFAMEGKIFFGEPIKKQITSDGGKVGDSDKDGIVLSVPQGALSSEIEFQIDTCEKCPLKLPDGYKPASPVYFISHGEVPHFQKEITVELNHYIDLKSPDDSKRLVFMTLDSSRQKSTSKYPFIEIEENEGIFEPDSLVGKIMLSHFSPLLIADKKRGADDNLCSVRLYRKKDSPEHKSVVCMCLDHPVFKTVCDQKIKHGYHGYGTDGEEKVSVSHVGFKKKSNEAKMRITNPTRWKITYDRENKFRKKDVYYSTMYEKTQLEEDPDYPPRVAINNLSMRRSSESNNKMPRLRMSGLDDKCDMALIICQAPMVRPDDTHLTMEIFNEMLPTMKKSIVGSVDALCLDAIAKRIMSLEEKAGILEGDNKFTHATRFLECIALKIEVESSVFYQFQRMLENLGTQGHLLQRIDDTMREKA